MLKLGNVSSDIVAFESFFSTLGRVVLANHNSLPRSRELCKCDSFMGCGNIVSAHRYESRNTCTMYFAEA